MIFFVVHLEAASVSFESIIQDAMQQSYELKIATLDIKISKAVVWEKGLDFLPQFNLRLSSEYTKDLRQQNNGLVSIGDTVINSGTRFQDSVAWDLSYRISDIYAKGESFKYALNDFDQKKYVYQKNRKELSLKLLEIYHKILVCQCQRAYSNEELLLQKELLAMMTRLQKAQLIAATELAETAIETTKLIGDHDGFVFDLKNYLSQLSYYTQKHYSAYEDQFLPLENMEHFISANYHIESAPEYKALELETAKKETEINTLFNELRPKLDTYISYNSYGADEKYFYHAIETINKQNFSAGIWVTIPFFDDIKIPFKYRRLRLELEKIQMEKARTKNQIQQELVQNLNDIQAVSENLKQKEVVLLESKHAEAMTEKLTGQQLIYKTGLLKKQISHLQEKLHWELAAIEKNVRILTLIIKQDGM